MSKEAVGLGLPKDKQRVSAECVMGIEVNPYAAELAQVTIWIGEIQWQLRNHFSLDRQPLLDNLHQISCRDALVTGEGQQTLWATSGRRSGKSPIPG